MKTAVGRNPKSILENLVIVQKKLPDIDTNRKL